MGMFDDINEIIKNLFSINGNGWVKRKNISSLNLENCNGVATSNESTRTCELCVALNETIFKNNNKPDYYHSNCKCKNLPTILTNIILDFSMDKIEKYLFINENKNKMMNSMGYFFEDSDDVYKTISNTTQKKFNNGNYILGNLSIHGQHFKIELIINGKREHSNNIYKCHIGCIAWPNGKIKIATPLIKD